MIKKIVFLPIIAIAIIGFGCDIPNHYHPDTENRPAAPFTGVSLSGIGDVSIHTGRPHGITVTADVDILDSVTANVNESGVLLIGVGESRIENGKLYMTCGNCREPIDIGVSTQELRGVALAGRGNIRIAAEASVDNLMIYHTGEGDIDAQNIKADIVTIVHTGSGRVKVWASDTLFASITTPTGEIVYSGEPEVALFDHQRLVEIISTEKGGVSSSFPKSWELSDSTVNRLVPPTALFGDDRSGVIDTSGLWLGSSDGRVLPSR